MLVLLLGLIKTGASLFFIDKNFKWYTVDRFLPLQCSESSWSFWDGSSHSTPEYHLPTLQYFKSQKLSGLWWIIKVLICITAQWQVEMKTYTAAMSNCPLRFLYVTQHCFLQTSHHECGMVSVIQISLWLSIQALFLASKHWHFCWGSSGSGPRY